MAESDGPNQSQPEHLQKCLPLCSTTASKTEFIVYGWAASHCKNISPQKLHIFVRNLLVNGNDVCDYCGKHLQIWDQSVLCWLAQTSHAIQFLAKITVNLSHITCCIKSVHYTHNTVPVCMTFCQTKSEEHRILPCLQCNLYSIWLICVKHSGLCLQLQLKHIFFIDFVSWCSNDKGKDGHAVNMWDTRNAYNTSVGKPNETTWKNTYTGCFTTCGHYCMRWFPRSLWSKISYKHVSDFGWLQSYGHFLIPVHALMWIASYGSSWQVMYSTSWLIICRSCNEQSRSSQPSGSLCCSRWWHFRKPALSTDQFKLKVIS